MLSNHLRFERDECDDQKSQVVSESTEGPHSPSSTSKLSFFNKEKSQLCRKFLQKGFCPYNKKCKFAHGSQELKKNNLKNSKYKTKQCGAFFNDLSCKFGERCNFLHQRKQIPEKSEKNYELKEYREVLYGAKRLNISFYYENAI